jgi:hypothetical protein
MVQIIISGDLIFLRILDEQMVVVNSQPIAEALLDKRSRIYSDRPYLATLEPYVLLVFFCSRSEVLAGTAGRSILRS